MIKDNRVLVYEHKTDPVFRIEREPTQWILIRGRDWTSYYSKFYALLDAVAEWGFRVYVKDIPELAALDESIVRTYQLIDRIGAQIEKDYGKHN